MDVAKEDKGLDEVRPGSSSVVGRQTNSKPPCDLLYLGDGIKRFKDIAGVEMKFLELCGKIKPKEFSSTKKLTQKDLDLALDKVKKAGNGGIPLKNRNRILKWVKFHDERMNNVFVVRKEGLSEHLIGICSVFDCFQPAPTPIDTRPLTCVRHRGELTRFALLRFENQVGNKTQVDLLNLEYRVSEAGTEDQDFDWAMRCKFGTRQPTNIEKFSTQQEFVERYAVCGTVWMFLSLVDPSIKYKQVTAIANGLEKQVKEELERHGWSMVNLVKKKKMFAKRIMLSFQTSSPPPPCSTLKDEVEEDTLYTMFNKYYQEISRNREKLLKQTLSSSHHFQMAIVGEFPRSEIIEMENCFITAMYISNLFDLPNPFSQSNPESRPHLLNKDINCHHLSDRSWNVILEILRKNYGVEITLIPTQTDNFHDVVMSDDGNHTHEEAPTLSCNTKYEPNPTRSSSNTSSILGKREYAKPLHKESDQKIRKIETDSETQLNDNDETQFFPPPDDEVMSLIPKKTLHSDNQLNKSNENMTKQERKDKANRIYASATQNRQEDKKIKHVPGCSNTKCKLCNKQFKCSETLGFHIKLQHLTCNICGGSVFNTVSNLKMHLEQHRKKYLFCPADQCYKPFESVESWHMHFTLNHGLNVPVIESIMQKCFFCDSEFKDVKEWNSHVPSHYYQQHFLDQNDQNCLENSDEFHDKTFQDLTTCDCKQNCESMMHNFIIPTCCKSVDDLLGGGIRTRSITEIIGPSGIGKTTFSLQLCLNVQLPSSLGGVNGDAVYIGTDNSFSSVRLSAMTQWFVIQWNTVLCSLNFIPKYRNDHFNATGVMSRIHLRKCITLEDLTCTLEIHLRNLLITQNQKHSPIRLIVLDGIDYPFFMTHGETHRSRMDVIHGYIKILEGYMHKYNLAIVVTNILTPFFDSVFGTPRTPPWFYLPYLGHNLSNLHPNQIIKMSEYAPHIKASGRAILLMKSAFHTEENEAKCNVDYEGIRD